jgi:hypothetical protein
MELDIGGDPSDWFFLAMACCQNAETDEETPKQHSRPWPCGPPPGPAREDLCRHRH